MGKRKVNYNKSGIDKLPNDKSVLYTILTNTGKTNYYGTASRGRVQERIQEHIGDIPGAKVTIEQFDTVKDARAKEARVIKRNQPKYNNQGK